VPHRDLKAPTVGVYISLQKHPSVSSVIKDLLADGVMVIPLVADIREYTSYVFEDLHRINGLQAEPEDPKLERIAAALLEGLNLLRRTRRLFVSYKRSETQSVAIQLYELFEAHGFDVFLDTHNVRPGEPFQEVLWHRLADTDVVVLLDSPGFLKSRWTQDELARANSTNTKFCNSYGRTPSSRN
jgi:hypothetical protein